MHSKTFFRLFYSALLLIAVISCKSETNFSEYVNPFIGTSGGGNTFPGAVAPWGMVSVSPHTQQISPAGFLFESDIIKGFGHVHLSGVGCPDLGSIIIMPGRKSKTGDSLTITSRYKNQVARAGYYSVELTDQNLLVELTASTRSGVMLVKNTGPADTIIIVIDAGRSLSDTIAGSVTKFSKSSVGGYNVSGGFCGTNVTRKTYFYTQVRHEPQRSYVWENGNINKNSSHVASDSLPVGAVFSYFLEQGESVSVHTGISYTDIDHAKQNLEHDQPDLSFEKVAAETTKTWNEQLSRVVIETTDETERTIFYTALYHMLLHPNIYSDADDCYRTFQAGTLASSAIPRYSVFSLWDTYRTVHPFYSIVYPERQKEMVETMLAMYTESGWLPKWELAGQESYVMTGDPAAIVVADSWIKGIKPEDEAEAFQAIRKSSSILSGNKIRPGWKSFSRHGFIAQDDSLEYVWGSVATGLEYALADFSVSQVANLLNNKKDHQLYHQKSRAFKHYFDTKTTFFRPRITSGEWHQPFYADTLDTPGMWPGSGGPGFVEGNAWQYNWFVPHAIPDLIKLYPSEQAFYKKLDILFDSAKFILWNEPDMNYPYIYNFSNEQFHKTSKIVHDNLKKHFKNEPTGLPGNDDCGTTSGWYVFASLGLYPFCPGTDEYALSIPLFSEATLFVNQERTRKWIITSKIQPDHADFNHKHIQINGRMPDRPWIDHTTIMHGGSIRFN